jgi:aminoglycoside phosphotransferase (APT) family kinase protein
MSIARDWIMRATHDAGCREAAFAAASPELPAAIRTPTLGVARDDGGHALLMTDIANALIPPEQPISGQQLEQIVESMAALHGTPPTAAGVPWCTLERRLALLTPAGAAIAAAANQPVARDISEGWRLFDRHAPRDIVALIRGLFDDLSPLLRALEALPVRLLHGDLKLDNIGLNGDGRMWLIDWAMTMVAPTPVDLGWFLAINSRRLPASLDETIARYDAATNMTDRARHDALTALCGLLLRGWRKALDAEAGEPDELRWWCERAREAAPMT